MYENSDGNYNFVFLFVEIKLWIDEFRIQIVRFRWIELVVSNFIWILISNEIEHKDYDWKDEFIGNIFCNA